MTRTIALLRGINVGGHKKIKMAELRALFSDLGFANVKTALASGNVAFDSDGTASQARIEAAIEQRFGFAVPVIAFPQQQRAHPEGDAHRRCDEDPRERVR